MQENKQKHAYLILAHNNFKILEYLIKSLDDERNDIYLHIDKKIKDFDFGFFSSLCTKSKLYFSKRTNVQWGVFSLIEAELNLFNMASKNNYAYYHLISGVDFPIKTQDYIHNFFNLNKGKEFIGFADNFIETNVSYLHIIDTNERRSYKFHFTKKFAISLQKRIIRTQHFLKYNHINSFNEVLKKGTNWVSLSHKAVIYLISQKRIINKFRFSLTPDEIYKQTILYNSPFKENIYSLNDEFTGCMRLIDWRRGAPYIFTSEDKEEIFRSDKLFCRKFDEKTDLEIIKTIYNHIKTI